MLRPSASGRLGAADVLTLGNGLAGASAVLLSTAPATDPAQRLRFCALLLVGATVLDVADGLAARRFGSTLLGGPLDALADLVSFGVAPAAIVTAYLRALPQPAVEHVLLVCAAVAYVAAALVRLARFLSGERQSDGFTGLPTTAAALVALSVAFLTTNAAAAALGLAVVAVLMVSPLRYPHGGRGRAALVSLLGWVFGVVALLGLMDPRIPAALTFVVFSVVVPLLAARSRPAEEPS